ncbi:MAG: SURF1 family protein [Galactobacter sp.]|uniref:SURF1 family protein n=1 Tax=Galactobacter sp. TaxID=2676125 RepID=UPI0025C3F7D2|nr:SURF1 family protein [Galactobacter sp.]
MLKTALKPKWILTLVGCLLLACVFVLLSRWQFGQSETRTVDPNRDTETAVALTDHFQPGRDMYVPDADQVVTMSGRFVPDSAVLVNNRLRNDIEGYWVVAAFQPDGAPDDNVIPVVRGWEEKAEAPESLPKGSVDIEGRLLPSEAPTETPNRDASEDGYPDLSAARLANVWDRDSYAGFVVAFTATTQDGTDVSAASAGLETVKVGPQPDETNLNWLNVFYGLEWVVFAGLALFVWWRLVADDKSREDEYQADLAAWEARQAARERLAARSTDHEPGAADPEHPTTENR